ncbi:SWI/SNF complex subunit [Peniophora sp. CONT]|nr:SWI/SNF complex subunit [Peniophora sp. CONT]
MSAMPEGQKPPKKRKLVDRTVPGAVLSDPAFSVDSKMYSDLQEMERKLDWTMMRKKAEIQDAMGRVATTSRTLRVFVSHTVSEQVWQTSNSDEPNFETGKGVPAWQLKIEGRLLEPANARQKDKAPRPFSTFVKDMIVEFERDPALYPDSNIVEWHRGTNQPTLDGYTIRRMGDRPTNIRISLYLDQHPEVYKIRSELAGVIGLKEGTQVEMIQAVWNYVKLQNLIDKTDRRRIVLDAPLKQLLHALLGAASPEVILFSSLPELVSRCVLRADPIKLHYTLDPTSPPSDKPQAWDIQIKVDDLALKAKMAGVTVNASPQATAELSKLDEEIAIQVQSMHASVLKRDFLSAFAEDPAGFVQRWVASQARDLETVMGSGPTDGATLRREDLQRSEYFRLPWVEEAVAVWEGMRLAQPQRT